MSDLKFDFKDFEKTHAIKIPKRYQDFFNSEECEEHNKLLVFEIFGYGIYEKFQVKFIKPSFKLFEEYGIQRTQYPNYFPIGFLKEVPVLMVIDTTDNKCPVLSWNKKESQFRPYSPSFDEFLEMLIEKYEKASAKKWKTFINRAHKLYDSENYEEAFSLLNLLLERYPIKKGKHDFQNDYLSVCYNLRGMCYEKMDKIKEAIQDYETSIQEDSNSGALNLMDLYQNEIKDYLKEIKIGETLKEKYLDEYHYYWVRRYLGYAYLMTENKKLAVQSYQEIYKRFVINDPDKIKKVVKELEELILEHPDKAKLAQDILQWFQVKKYDLTSEQIQKNRSWWENLKNYGDFWQPTFKKIIKLDNDKEPSDNDIARLFEIETLIFNDHYNVSDVTPLTNFSKLRYLSFDGDIKTLEPLKGIKTLTDLSVNNEVIKNLKLPSEKNKLFFKAAEDGDFDTIKNLLKQGVDVNAKDKYGDTALHYIMMNHDIDQNERTEIASYLINKGADIYAEAGMDHNTPMDFCNESDRNFLIDTFQKAGGVKEESPFRVWVRKYENNTFQLDFLCKVEKDYEIGEGIPMLKDFPVDAYYPIRKRSSRVGYLTDCFVPMGGEIVVNLKIKEFLEKKALKNIEYLPVHIHDHDGKTMNKTYFIVHPIHSQDCLDIEKSEPSYNHIDKESISDVKRLVIDEKRLDAEVKIFRIKNYDHEIFLRKELAIEILQQNFSGIAFKEPKR